MLPSRIEKLICPEPMSGCWLWAGTHTGWSAYGSVRWNGRMRVAHRVIYELLRGEIAPGLELDHACNVRFCVNPDHLQPVTPAENVARMVLRRKACRNGHVYSGTSFRLEATPSGGTRRVCRVCAARNMARFTAREGYRERRREYVRARAQAKRSVA
jgi:hypothetical protein